MILRLQNGETLDIGNQKVPITIQAIDIGRLSSRFVSTTPSIKLPLSEVNIQFFQFAHDIRSSTDIVYTSIECTLIDDGVEVMRGYLVIRQVETHFEIQVLEKTIDFFNQIENKSLRELDFGDSPITFDATYIDSRRAATSGIVCPVVSYGQIDPTGSAIGDYYLPSVSLDTIVQAIASNAGYTITGDLMSLSHYTNAILAYSYNGWPGTSFVISQIMPDMKQTDLMQWVLIAFGALITESGNTLTLHRFEDIFNNTSRSVDWTDKRTTDRKDNIKFSYSNYARMNVVKAKTPYSSDEFTSGSLDIDNPQLKAESTLYESPILVADDTIQVNNDTDFIYCALIPWWEEGNLPTGYPPVTPFDTDPEPVILLTRERYTSEPSVTYNGNSRTDYRVAYGAYLRISTDVINPLSTEWSALDGDVGWLDVNYPNLQRSLNRQRILTRYYNLSVSDIHRVDLSKMVFDQDSYYLINKIDKFVSGDPTKVELLKRTYGDIPVTPQRIIVSTGYADLTVTGFAPNITVVT